MEIPLSLRRLGGLGFLTAIVAVFLRFWMASQGLQDPYSGWQALGVPAMEIPFFDLDNGICQAFAYANTGHDPYTDGSFNPRGILANYPPLMLHTLGPLCHAIGAWKLGLILCTGALLALGLSAGRLTFAGGLLMGLAAAVGGPALALERGNSDLLLVPVVALAVWAPYRLSETRPLAAIGAFAAFIWLGCTLKLFPALALGACLALPTRRDRLLAMLAGAMAAGTYVVFDYKLISTLLANTPVSFMSSYGIQTTLLYIELPPDEESLLRLAMLFTLSMVAFVVFWRLFKQKPATPTRPDTLPYGLALAGACIFCGTYLTSASFEYRLIFLLLCLPYLLGRSQRVYLLIALGVVLFTSWPALEALVRQRLWGHRIELGFFFLRQALGLTLAGIGVGWLIWQAFDRLLAEEPVASLRSRVTRQHRSR